MASALMAFVQGLVAEQEAEKPSVEATPPTKDDDMFVDSDEEDTSKKESAPSERAAPTTLLDVARTQHVQEPKGASSLLEVAKQQQQEATKTALSALAAQLSDEEEKQRREQVERTITAVAQEVRTEQKAQVAAQVSSVLKDAAAETYAGDDFEADAYDDDPDENITEAAQILAQQKLQQQFEKKPPSKKKPIRAKLQHQNVASTTLKDKLSSFQCRQLTLTQRRLLLAMVVDDKPHSSGKHRRGVNMEAINELAKDRERRRQQQQGRNRKLVAEFAKLDDNKHCRFRPRLHTGGGSREQQHGNSDDEDGGNAKSEDFVRRMEAAERARKEGLRRTREEKIYLSRVDKKECPACGNPQSYAELSQKRKKCPNCGVTYRSRIAWSTIADEFLSRLETYVAAREGARSAPSPPGKDASKSRRRLTWQEVRDEFLGRIQLDLEHREMSKAAIWKEMTETWTFRPVITHRAKQLNLEPFDERLERDLENRRQRRRQYERLKLALKDPEQPKPEISKRTNAYVPAASFQERLRADLQRRREREQEAEARGPRGARQQLSRAC